MSASDPALKIQPFRFSHEALGAVFDYVANTKAFARFEAAVLVRALRQQLTFEQNMFAHREGTLVGYCGWLLTDMKSGEIWLESEAAVRPLPEAEAALLTIVRADETRVLRALIRRCRTLYPRKRIFFKRVYGDGARRERRDSVACS